MRPFARLLVAFLLGSAPVGAPRADTLELESVGWLRHDYFGETYLPTWHWLRVDRPVGPTRVRGYLGLAWEAGFEHAVDPDFHHLSVRGPLGSGSWTLGRQQGAGALRMQTFDGASVTRPLGDHLSLEAWAGLARHQDLDDLVDNAAMSRLGLGWRSGPVQARGGAEVQAGAGTPPVLRQDLEGRIRLGSGARPARLHGRAVVAEAAGDWDSPLAAPVPEWAEAGLSVRPFSALEARVHALHRETADPGSLFGDALLQTLAGGSVQEAGLGLRVFGTRHAVLSGRYAVLLREDDRSRPGHRIDLSWFPPLGSRHWHIVPAVSSRMGAYGQYHALTARGRWSVSDATTVHTRAAVVPFQAQDDPWDLALTGGLELQQACARWMRVRAMVDAARDREQLVDLRGGLALTVGWP